MKRFVLINPKLRMRVARRQLRRGATLSEVLISILIMSIGLVSVMSLFPLAMVRSIQGHALTTATNLRFSAESAVDLYPRMVIDPDVGDSSVYPALNSNGTWWDDQPTGTAFLVDPFGCLNFAVGSGTRIAGGNTLQRYHAGFNTQAQAERLFASPDQWISAELTDTNFSIINSSEIKIPGLSSKQIYITSPGSSAPLPTRIVLFDETQISSPAKAIVRTLDSTANLNAVLGTNATADHVYLSYPIPSSFSPTRFRIEQNDLRFTWLLTVRNVSPASPVVDPTDKRIYQRDVVVFFNRSYAPEDSTGYGGSLGTAGNLVFQYGKIDAQVNWVGSAPFLKKGGFVLDAINGHWYGIQDYAEGAGITTLTLDRPAKANSTSAVFMRTIVAVYHIDDFTYTPSRN